MDTFYNFIYLIVAPGMEHTVSLSATCDMRLHPYEMMGKFLPGLYRTDYGTLGM